MNVHDSEKIAGIFSENGYEESQELRDSNIIVLNTCTIRAKAEQKFSSELGRLKIIKKKNPDLKIAVAGCIAQQKGKSLFKRFPYIDFVFGPNNIDSVHGWINNGSTKGNKRSRRTHTEDNHEYHTKLLPVKREGEVRAWVSIMYGCNNFCAYCVVPYTRGRERSRPGQDIIDEARSLADGGFKEVTLLGQNVNSYGKLSHDNIDFPDLLRKLHEDKKLERIRFVTSHPRDFSDKLIGTMKELPKVCDHMHLPLQSGSDRILKLMNRGYTYNEYKGKIDRLRHALPDVAVTTDIIVGFPGETDEDYQETVSAISEIAFDGIYAFKYSERPDTKALELPDHVDEQVKSMRLQQVLDMQEKITYQKNLKLEGTIVEILVEGPSESDPEKMTGRTGTNKIVHFHGDKNDIAQLIRVRIDEAKLHSLYGEKL